ncbi:MAG: LarC family nickel insertion protein, partial [Gaiellaceae bacterium]
MSRLAYLDCVGGLAGDMLLAALLDAGAERALLKELPSRLEIGAVTINITEVERSGVAALHVDVVPPDDPPPRTWRRMRELVEAASLSDAVKQRALRAFSLLAAAEAKLHRVDVDDVHFHEIGGVDTLVDICGAALLLEDLSIARVECSPLPYSRGLVRAAHGVLPVPAPATVELLRGAQLEGVGHQGELVTPTGAALAVGLAEAFGPPPLLTLESVGYGAGTDDPSDRP